MSDPRDRLIGALLRPPPPAPELSPAQRARLAAAFTTLDPALEDFLVLSLPRLLRQLRHRAVRTREEGQDRVRGVIDWSASWKLQATRGPGAWVSRRPEPRYDLPENQLLLMLHRNIATPLARPTALSGLRCWDRRHPQGVAATLRLAHLSEALRRLEQSPRLAGLGPPADLELALRRAEDTGQPEYQQLAALVQGQRALATAPDAAALAAAQPRVVLLPSGPDADEALWTWAALQLLHPEVSHARPPAPARPPPRPAGRPAARRGGSGLAMAV